MAHDCCRLPASVLPCHFDLLAAYMLTFTLIWVHVHNTYHRVHNVIQSTEGVALGGSGNM